MTYPLPLAQLFRLCTEEAHCQGARRMLASISGMYEAASRVFELVWCQW